MADILIRGNLDRDVYRMKKTRRHREKDSQVERPAKVAFSHGPSKETILI